MFTSNFFSIRFFAAVFAVLILGASAYGFAAGNTVPDGKVGDGSGTVSGYTVSNVAYYTEDGDTDPGTLDKITFDLDAAASTVKVKPDADGANWFSCADQGSNAWSCTITSTNTADVDQLRVVASE